MKPANKITFLLIFMLSVLNVIILATPCAASSQPVPQFTLKHVDNSYDVPPTTTSTTDPYTGQTTTTTTPGYHVANKTIEAVIKNPAGASYYNFRYKGHYENQWSYYPCTPNNYDAHNTESPSAFPVSPSDYTTIELYFLPNSVPQEGQIDVQVQALYGNYSQVHEGSIGAMMLGINETFNFYFEGEAGDWSNTQTITIGNAPTPTPTTSAMPSQNPTATPETSPAQTGGLFGLDWEKTALIVMAVAIAALAVAVVVLWRKTAAK